MQKEQRIAIIGAGAAGLTAAEILHELGYTNITIFEILDRVGGQTCSGIYDAPNNKKIIYDIGSLQPFGYKSRILGKFIKKYKIKFGRGVANKHNAYFKIYSIAQKKIILDFTRYYFGFSINFKLFLNLLKDILKLYKQLFSYNILYKIPGYQLSAKKLKNLNIPMFEWVDHINLSVIKDSIKFLIGNIIAGSNEKLVKNISGIYFVKFISLLMRNKPHRYIDGSYMPVKQGYQHLWDKIAKNHHIIFNANITAINRQPEGKVKICYNKQIHEFAKLIITCDPKSLLEILDVNLEEQTIFNNIQYSPIWRGVFIAKDLPTDAAYAMFEPVMQPGFYPHLSAFVPEDKIDEHTWLYQAVIAYDKPNEIDHILKSCEIFLKEHFNSKMIKWIKVSYWPQYCPRFSITDVQNGIYNQLEQLQGLNHAFYINNLNSGASNTLVSDYAETIIRKYF